MPDEQRAHERTSGAEDDRQPVLLRLGSRAWALLGVLILLAGLLYATGQIMLVVVPLVLALFPAALLQPVSRWLKDHKVPASLASLLTIFGAILLLAGVIAALVPLVLAELPELVETGEEGLQELQAFIDDDPLGLGIGGVDELLGQVQDAVGEFGEFAGQALEALVAAVEAVAALVFLLVALFFYLKDDVRMARGIGDFVPSRMRGDANEIGRRVWETLGGFFRGQLLVALVDAVFIGVGLLILGIPLALPLAVLIFFGGLFPIIGAFVTGFLAVLVALADGGLVMGLLVLGLIIAVQQLESNILEPLVLGKVIRLHPLLIIVAVTGGGITVGILGAFLAVPIVASIARVVEYLRERNGDADEDGDADEPEGHEGAGAGQDTDPTASGADGREPETLGAGSSGRRGRWSGRGARREGGSR
jgi:putative heme transporter